MKTQTIAPDIVGREYNTYKDDSLFAATPPLEALRITISHAATARGAVPRTGYRELMIKEVSWDYFYVPAARSLLIQLPEEDLEAKKGEAGRLNV